MRRFWPALLAFFGVACVTAAIAIPLFLVPNLRVVPLDLDITSNAASIPEDGSTADSVPATIFDRCSVSQAKAKQYSAHLTQQRRSIIVDPSDSHQATLQSAQTVQIDKLRDADGKETDPTMAAADAERTCNDGLLTASIDHVSVNRKTSVPNGTVSYIQLEAAPEGVDVKDVSVRLDNRKGFQYKFGFNVKKRDYLYYDLNTRTDNAAKFFEEKTIDGVKVYGFVSEVPETDLSSLPNPQGEAALGTMLTMPAKWWGITGRGVRPDDKITMHRYASATRYVWVEPETGTIVDGKEEQHQYFKSPDQSDSNAAAVRDFRFDALKATFKWEDSTVSLQTSKADHYRGLLKMGGVWLPLALGILGVLLLAAWLWTVLRRRRADDTDDSFSAVDDDRVDPDDTQTTVDGGRTPRHSAAATTASATAAATTRFNTPEADAAETTAIDPQTDTPASGLDPWERPTEQIPRVEDDPGYPDNPENPDQPTKS